MLGLPEDKKAQRFIPLDTENFYYHTDRTDAYTVIEINMIEGRTIETKKALIKALFQQIESQLGIAPLVIEITIKEQPAYCWGFQGMIGDKAHYLKRYKVNI